MEELNLKATETIDDPKDSVVRRVADILRTSHKSQQRFIMIDDELNVLEAIQNNVTIDSIYWTGEREPSAGLANSISATLPSYSITTDVAKSLFKTEKRSRFFAIARAPKAKSFANLDISDRDVLILDGVRLSGNIGAIIRTSVAFEAAGIVLINSEVSNVYDRRLVRASRGTVFSLPVIISDASKLAQFLHESGMPLVSMSAHRGAPIGELGTLMRPLALLLGSEKQGSSDFLEDLVAERYRIYTSAKVESLNVSIAAALALHERARHRGGSTTRL